MLRSVHGIVVSYDVAHFEVLMCSWFCDMTPFCIGPG